jgi:hypothetical protein
MRRRTFLCGITALPASASFSQALGTIPQRASLRVIVDNDFSGDPDGLIALTHQLLTPKARTVLVTTSAVDPKLAKLAGIDAGKSPAAASRLVQELMDRLGLASRPPVVAGTDSFAAGKEKENAAAQAIVAEALRDDPLPLVLTCGGPLTNVAAALRLDPRIATRMKVVWIGGVANSEGGAEYNQSTDLAAARHVLEESAVPLWQVPEEEYKRFQVSVAELTIGLRDISPVSQWLYSQYLQLPPFVQLGGSLGFGDDAMVALTAFDPGLAPSTIRRVRKLQDDGRYGAQVAGREVRMLHSLDVRLHVADLTALLRLHRSKA